MKSLSVVLLITFLFSRSIYAQEVIPPSKEFPDKIWLKIVQVIPGTADSLELINHNLKMMTLICAHNPIFASTESTITYTNYMNIEAMKFKFEEDRYCFDLKVYLTMTFEMISEREPLYIQLSRSEGKVTKIVYPNIDPLEDGPFPINTKEIKGKIIEVAGS